jgi:hypothetical protein
MWPLQPTLHNRRSQPIVRARPRRAPHAATGQMESKRSDRTMREDATASPALPLDCLSARSLRGWRNLLDALSTLTRGPQPSLLA